MASKAEYLKKYLSPAEPTSEEKRKKKRKTKKVKNVRVHDDDLDWKKLAPKIDEYDDDDPEEAPVVIDITGDDPETNFKWKAVQPASPVNLSIVKVEKSPSPSPSHPSPNHQPNNSNQKIKKKRKERVDSPDFSPPRRKTLKETDDLSPPRRGKSPNDISPPRRRNSPGDISPPRKRTKIPEPNSNSKPRGSRTGPPRTKQHSLSSDTSPPRKPSSATPRSRLDSSQSDLSLPRHSPPPVKMILGSKRAGLQSGDAAQEEVLRANAERERFIRSLDPLVSGRNAPTVYRNKEGKRIDPNAPENPLTEEEKKQKEEDDLQFAQWGRGVAQVQSAQDKVEDDLYEMSKPLARYRDDEDLEKFLKEREREDDPMLKFLTKKKKKGKKGGNPRLNRPTFKGSWPQNRFGIPPGYRWDGVDRSNGYENKRYALKAEKESIKEFAYKWSVEEM